MQGIHVSSTCNDLQDSVKNSDTNSGVSASAAGIDFADDDPILDSILSAVDINEATKTYVLAEKFHITHFKDFQKLAVDAALNKRDTLIVQPTGQGKSLCYQFPAVYAGRTTIVITSTISLMQDQTLELNNKGIKATFLGSAQTDPAWCRRKSFQYT